MAFLCATTSFSILGPKRVVGNLGQKQDLCSWHSQPTEQGTTSRINSRTAVMTTDTPVTNSRVIQRTITAAVLGAFLTINAVTLVPSLSSAEIISSPECIQGEGPGCSAEENKYIAGLLLKSRENKEQTNRELLENYWKKGYGDYFSYLNKKLVKGPDGKWSLEKPDTPFSGVQKRLQKQFEKAESDGKNYSSARVRVNILASTPEMNPDEINHNFASSLVFYNFKLLEFLQLSPHRPFKDSKRIVDSPLRHNPNRVLKAFKDVNPQPSKREYLSFLTDNFHLEDRKELQIYVQEATPSDYNENPPGFTKIVRGNPKVLEFAQCLKRRWVQLCREFRPVIKENSDLLSRTSLIPLRYPFFIPGGRFQECYYWDTLWTVKGLVECDMITSAQNAVRNLMDLVNRFGFVPNGNRVYYMNRSQPPVLTEAVRVIYQALLNKADQIEWLKEATPVLDKEVTFFHEHRSIAALKPNSTYSHFSLSLYSACTSKPRPESYIEDVLTANCNKDRDESSTFHNIASGAESGWDFSSRWFEPHSSSLSSICIENIIPVCLNSWLLHSERTISEFYFLLSNDTEEDECKVNHFTKRAHDFQKYAESRQLDMIKLFWKRESGTWHDFNISTKTQSSVISVAYIMPIWAGCTPLTWNQHDTDRFIQWLTSDSGLVGASGIACTNNQSGQQWDSPNCWAPLVDLCVEGLMKLATRYPRSRAHDVAVSIAHRFVKNAFKGWDHNGSVMHEKYNFNSENGERGAGGEYVPQTGFGWTNGTVLSLMNKFSEEPNFFNFDL